MPGFVGICSNVLNATKESVANAVQATVYSAKTSVKEIHADSNILVQKSIMNFLDHAQLSMQSNGVHVWLDGEIYNEQECAPGQIFVDAVLQHYQKNTLPD